MRSAGCICQTYSRIGDVKLAGGGPWIARRLQQRGSNLLVAVHSGIEFVRPRRTCAIRDKPSIIPEIPLLARDTLLL